VSLHLKAESAFLQFFVFLRIEPIQLAGRLPTGHLPFLEFLQQTEAQDLFSEIAFIKRRFEPPLS